MNCGLQDAVNLAWKLALVYHGAADAALLDSYEAERRPVAEMITKSGDNTERAQTLIDPTESRSRDKALRAALADPAGRHHEAVAEAELNVNYLGSPIVSGDSDIHLAPGQRLPDSIPVRTAGTGFRRIHKLTHRAGHTLLLVGGPSADGKALAELLDAVKDFAADSPMFEAAIGLGTSIEIADRLGRLEPDAAALLGVRDITLLAVRPDGYLGLRADGDHLEALERYREILRTGNP